MMEAQPFTFSASPQSPGTRSSSRSRSASPVRTAAMSPPELVAAAIEELNEAKRHEAQNNLASAQATAGEPPHSPRATARNLSFGRRDAARGAVGSSDDDDTLQDAPPLNVMILGPPASGKSTLASTLRTLSRNTLRFVAELPDDADVQRCVDAQHKAYLGYNHATRITIHAHPITPNSQEQDPLRSVPMSDIRDTRPAVALVVLPPHGGRLEHLPAIARVLPTVALMGKADAMTTDEREALRRRIALALAEAKPAEPLSTHYAVVGGVPVERGREYDWGTVLPLVHSDVGLLVRALGDAADALRAGAERRYLAARTKMLLASKPKQEMATPRDSAFGIAPLTPERARGTLMHGVPPTPAPSLASLAPVTGRSMSRALDPSLVVEQRRSRARWLLILPLLLLVLLGFPAAAARFRGRASRGVAGHAPASLGALRSAVEADVMAQVIAEHVPPPPRNATPFLTSTRLRVAVPEDLLWSEEESVGADVVADELADVVADGVADVVATEQGQVSSHGAGVVRFLSVAFVSWPLAFVHDIKSMFA